MTVGIVALGTSLTWLGQDRQPPNTFTQPAGAATPSATTAPLTDITTLVPPGEPGIGDALIPPADAAGQSPAAVTPAPATVAGPPARLTISTLTVDAPVDPVLSVGRVLRPPDDPLRVGWWIASSPAGSDRGSTVIVGHVDTAAAGPGALFRLTELRPGTDIVLHTAEEELVRYSVTTLIDYSKTGDLPAELFRTSGPPQLTLVTCGGEFDEATESYSDNIVVTAVRAP